MWPAVPSRGVYGLCCLHKVPYGRVLRCDCVGCGTLGDLCSGPPSDSQRATTHTTRRASTHTPLGWKLGRDSGRACCGAAQNQGPKHLPGCRCVLSAGRSCPLTYVRVCCRRSWHLFWLAACRPWHHAAAPCVLAPQCLLPHSTDATHNKSKCSSFFSTSPNSATCAVHLMPHLPHRHKILQQLVQRHTIASNLTNTHTRQDPGRREKPWAGRQSLLSDGCEGPHSLPCRAVCPVGHRVDVCPGDTGAICRVKPPLLSRAHT